MATPETGLDYNNEWVEDLGLIKELKTFVYDNCDEQHHLLGCCDFNASRHNIPDFYLQEGVFEPSDFLDTDELVISDMMAKLDEPKDEHGVELLIDFRVGENEYHIESRGVSEITLTKKDEDGVWMSWDITQDELENLISGFVLSTDGQEDGLKGETEFEGEDLMGLLYKLGENTGIFRSTLITPVFEFGEESVLFVTYAMDDYSEDEQHEGKSESIVVHCGRSLGLRGDGTRLTQDFEYCYSERYSGKSDKTAVSRMGTTSILECAPKDIKHALAGTPPYLKPKGPKYTRPNYIKPNDLSGNWPFIVQHICSAFREYTKDY